MNQNKFFTVKDLIYIMGILTAVLVSYFTAQAEMQAQMSQYVPRTEIKQDILRLEDKIDHLTEVVYEIRG